jgi:glycosyltransferase involved in cell wall biosynthesis
MNNYKKILFICNPDSTHSISWINQLNDSDFDVRVFSAYINNNENLSYPEWKFPTYVMEPPRDKTRVKNKLLVYYLSKIIPIPISRILIDKFGLKQKWLKKIILNWKPDIIHSFPLNVGGKLATRTLKSIKKDLWPRWVASSWGSDLFLGIEGEKREKDNIKYILENCDGFFSDCNRDLNIAKNNGLNINDAKFSLSLPGTGGVDLELFKLIREKKLKRNIILIPKAYEREHANKIFPFLEALKLCDVNLLEGFEIHFLMISDAVKKAIKFFPEKLKKICFVNDMISQDKLFYLMSKTRIMVSLSLSDGTPNVMLEAMAAGALPVMHPLDSIKEWIVDQENGLLVHSLYPHKIKKAIIKSLTDDNLFENSSSLNFKLIKKKADRKILKSKIIESYESLL